MRFVRNLHTQVVVDGWGMEVILWHYAEMLRVAGWTYNSDNGDPGWASALNILVNEPGGGPNGFEVDPTDPLVIYDPLGRFTQAMEDGECAIFLNAVSDQNAGAWRIRDYLGPNRVRIDYYGRPPSNWSPETQIPGRILDVNGLRLANGAWILFDAPAPSKMQVRLYKVTNADCQVLVRPSGQDVTGTGDDIAFGGGICTLTDAAGLFQPNHVGRSITIAGSGAGNNGTFTVASYISPTQVTYANAGGSTENPFPGTWTISGDPAETGSKSPGYVNTDRTRMNMVADGFNVVFYDITDEYRMDVTLIGELEDTDPGDDDTGCIWGNGAVSGTGGIDTPWNYNSLHLDDATPRGQLTGYVTFLKAGWDVSASSQYNAKAYRRLVNGYAFLRSPWVIMDGYVRGRLPSLVRFTNINYEALLPLDGSGLWQYIQNGIAVPRNGPNDPILRRG